MQLTILNKKEEPLLSRAMLKAVLEFENATPPYAEVASLIAQQLKTEEKLIAIRHIYTYFGERKADVMAYVYASEDEKRSIEPKIREKKEKKKEEAKKI